MASLFSNTVAALSTAPGKAGIAVIRVSGIDCFSIVSKVFFPRSGKKITDYKGASAVFGDFIYENEALDNGLCTVFYAPHSYTGEDTAELSCHGSELGVSLILSALFAAGAVPAGPGEFTRRAFLNGKLTLSQAEAVGDLIDADNTAALRLSNAKVAGKLSEALSALSDEITNILASVYAVIDYPDEDLAELSGEEMKERLSAVLSRLEKLCASYNGGRAVTGGIPTAIVGLPNSGKSSLLNLLTETDRAIVTDIAGTTRDVITEKAHLGNITLLLSDTAGIRKTDDAVEKIGVERAKRTLSDAELIFAVLDGTTPFSDGERALCEALRLETGKNILYFLNKSDKGILPEKKSDLAAVLPAGTEILSFSAKFGDGRDALLSRLSALYPVGDREIREGKIVTGARMYAALCGAKACVSDALETLFAYTPDLAGTDLERALSFLSEADGRSVTQEIVDRIFAKFCVGK